MKTFPSLHLERMHNKGKHFGTHYGFGAYAFNEKEDNGEGKKKPHEYRDQFGE